MIRLLALLVALVPFAAHAAPELRLGGDYVLDGGPGIFSLQLGVDTPLARNLAVGARFGALVTTSPSTAGVPLDVFLRARIERLYLEAVGGPWIFFEGDTLRGHGAVGFGLVQRSVEFGLEVGSVGFSHAMVGVRLGFRL